MFEQLIAMFSVRCDKQTAERENLDIEFLNFMDKSQIAYIHVRVQKKILWNVKKIYHAFFYIPQYLVV